MLPVRRLAATPATVPCRGITIKAETTMLNKKHVVCASVLFAFPLAGHAESGPAAGCPDHSARQSLATRFIDTYADYLKWNGDPADAEPNWRKGYQAPPVSSAPMPFSNWPVGGSENIGYENAYYGPFMDAVYCGPEGKYWKESRLTVYGWLNPGMNVSTSKSRYNFVSGTGGNWPASYSYQPNTAQLDQLALYIERTPDVVQTDHVDWGFRLATVYGTDYKYTFAKGVASDQYTQHQKHLGADMVMAYGELYFPQVAEGLNVRFGRYISIPDIEAQLAPNNYNYSHSLLYSYDPYTQPGVVFTFKLNKNWQLQLEASVGNDVAFWDKNERQFTPAACVQWTSDSGNDAIYPCINGSRRTGIGNDGKWRWNNLQHEVATWYHKFNDSWHMSTEAWYMYQNDTPNVNNRDGLNLYLSSPQVAGLNIGAPFGAQCDSGVVTCRSTEWAFVNYLVYQWTPRDFVSLRNGIFNDRNGQRTGFATRYQEIVLGWNHWLGKAITLRPEIRYERAQVDAYDNPCGIANIGCGKKNQAMFAMDAIIHF
jgi:hypothetical protein